MTAVTKNHYNRTQGNKRIILAVHKVCPSFSAIIFSISYYELVTLTSSSIDPIFATILIGLSISNHLVYINMCKYFSLV